jgi:hypothetical protein
MAELTAAARKKIPAKQFAGPGRSYPIEDRSHAINAKARAKQQLDAGRLSSGEYSAIVSKANKKLGKGKGKDEDKDKDGGWR